MCICVCIYSITTDIFLDLCGDKITQLLVCLLLIYICYLCALQHSLCAVLMCMLHAYVSAVFVRESAIICAMTVCCAETCVLIFNVSVGEKRDFLRRLLFYLLFYYFQESLDVLLSNTYIYTGI